MLFVTVAVAYLAAFAMAAPTMMSRTEDIFERSLDGGIDAEELYARNIYGMPPTPGAIIRHDLHVAARQNAVRHEIAAAAHRNFVHHELAVGRAMAAGAYGRPMPIGYHRGIY